MRLALRSVAVFVFQGSPAHYKGAAPIPQEANGSNGYKKADPFDQHR
jgi:hypothetical protein